MIAAHGGDTVPAGFRARDAAVVVVVVQFQRVAFCLAVRLLVVFCDRGGRFFGGRDDLHGERRATVENGEGGFGFAGVHGEAVAALDRDDAVDEPALVQVRQPFGDVLGHLLIAIQSGRGEGQVEGIAGEGEAGEDVGRAQAAVVGFAARDDMLDVDFVGPTEGLSGVGAVEAASSLRYNLRFEALWIAVVVGLVGRAAVFRLDGDAGQPVSGRGRGFEPGQPVGQLVLCCKEVVYALGQLLKSERALGPEAGRAENDRDDKRGYEYDGYLASHALPPGRRAGCLALLPLLADGGAGQINRIRSHPVNFGQAGP